VSLLSRAFNGALDVAFPPRCLGCGDFGEYFCEDCLASAPRAKAESRCARCWMRTYGPCRDCARFQRRFVALRTPFVYDGIAKSAVHALKFEGVSALAPTMGPLIAETFRQWSPAVESIVPVPLGWLRKRRRGYNQAELLAGEVGRATGLPLARDALRRARQTRAQSQQPGVEARRRNVAGAFEAGKRPVSGAVLLIDDVTTTGATLDACAGILLDSGASAVYALAFARED
jgi:ComF family protein